MHARLFAAGLLVLSAPRLLAAQSTDLVRQRLDSALRGLEAKGFSGVVRVDREGVTLLEKGYGLANRADRTPFSPSSVVQIGSNTKDFTLVSLLQLQERGRIGFGDSLFKYFPSAPADKRNITIRQLVDHRAGFPIGLGGDFEPLSRDEFLALAFKRPLNFSPGAGEQYSNTGYAILAAIIERVTGAPYDVYVRDNILAPLGLTHTGLLLPSFDPKLLAHGYRNGEDQGTMLAKPHAADGPHWNLRGNGGMLSTAADMHVFYTALFETDKLLKPASRGARFDPTEPIGLAGSDLVNFFLYERLPRRRIEIIIASNTAEFRERPVRQAIGEVLGLPSPDGPRVVASGATKVNVHPPTAAVASVANELVMAVNSGDSAAVRKFIAEHFLMDSGPPIELRVQRMLTMHQNLGALKIVALDQVDPTTLEITIDTANEGTATLKLAFDGPAMRKIVSMAIMVGG